MPELDPLVRSYVHLAQMPRATDALQILKKVASLVKPIMRARGWKVGELTEFYPSQSNLLGLNVNRGRQICLRLRFPGDKTLFMPIENIVDTMLHELCHIVHGPHDGKFHALWNQLRDEHQGLVMKGYTGEGFLSEGRRLGGSGSRIPQHEARRLAREAAERRSRGTSMSGQRLGGSTPLPRQDMRRVIADAVERRNKTLQGCGTENLSEGQIRDIGQTATQNGFRTQAEEDEANEAAIAQALWEMVQEEEKAKAQDSNGSLTSTKSTEGGERKRKEPEAVTPEPTEPELGLDVWVCGTCTLHNPSQYLCCNVCGAERSGEASRDMWNSKGSTSKAKADSAPSTATQVIDLTKTPSPPKQKKAPAQTTQKRQEPKQKKAPAQTTQKRQEPKQQEQQQPKALFWQCSYCGQMSERQWWTCAACGRMKDNSR